MSSPNNKIEAIQGLGGKLSAALRESQSVIEKNQFFLSSSNSTLAKYAFWAAAGAGLAAGVVLAPAAPAVAAIGVGVSVGVGVIGSALERIAGEREYMRQEHQQFMVQAKEFMSVLKAAYTDVKQEAQEEQRAVGYQNADFIQYQESRQQLAQQKSADLNAGSQLSVGVESKPKADFRMS